MLKYRYIAAIGLLFASSKRSHAFIYFDSYTNIMPNSAEARIRDIIQHFGYRKEVVSIEN